MAVIRMKGIKIKNLDQLREHLDFTNAKDYLLQGTLAVWMREQGETELADELEKIQQSDIEDQMLLDEFFRISLIPEKTYHFLRAKMLSDAIIASTEKKLHKNMSDKLVDNSGREVDPSPQNNVSQNVTVIDAAALAAMQMAAVAKPLAAAASSALSVKRK